jgi:hypothetical protein
MMKQLSFTARTKKEGLNEFRRQRWLLADATYQPVDKLSDSDCDAIIDRDYQLLRNDLLSLMPDKSIPLILIKANVCRLLGPRLTEDGFRVLNGERVVYFPSHGRQREFHEQFLEILKLAGITLL